mgnify:CR=1 FL=1
MLLCLICGWKICLKEKERIQAHQKGHNGAVFVKCENGNPAYLYKEKAFVKSSLYLNYLG